MNNFKVAVQPVSKVLSCPVNTTLDSTKTKCVPLKTLSNCKDGYMLNGSGKCVTTPLGGIISNCKDGYVLNGANQCVPACTKDSSGQCVQEVIVPDCAAGTVRSGSNMCIPVCNLKSSLGAGACAQQAKDGGL
jgi:hypothetical protein